MKGKTFLAKRKWLNPAEYDDTGMMSASVSADGLGVSGGVSIWDCSRKISMDFWFEDEKTAKQRAKKLDDMISMLQEMKVAMGEAYDWYIEHEKDWRYDD